MVEKNNVMLIAAGTEIMPHPPLGLLSIAAVLREKNHAALIKDYSGIKITDELITKDIENANADIIAISALTGPYIERGIQIGRVAKTLGKKVGWGGPHVTILPKITLEHPTVDAVVIGEAEATFPKLVDYLRGNGPLPNGVGIKNKDGIITITPQADEFVDINVLPLPAWDMLESIDRYFPYEKHNSVIIAATRGCVYKCGFCHNANKDVKGYGGPYRNLDAARVLKEFEFVRSLTKKHIDRMDIGGDLHFSSPSYVKKFCQDLIALGSQAKWNTSSTMLGVPEEDIDLIAKAGCESIMFGVESGSPRIQMMLGKPIDYEKAKRVTKKLRSKGILVTCTYMMGHPTETWEEVLMTLKYMRTIQSDQNLLQFYRPFPGTPYYDLLVEKKGVEPPKKLEDCATFGVLGYEVNMTDIPTAKLLGLYYRANLYAQIKFLFNLERFYFRNAMYEQFKQTMVNNKFTYKLKEFLVAKKW